MNKLITLTAAVLCALTSQAQNVGAGTNSPKSKLHVHSANLLSSTQYTTDGTGQADASKGAMVGLQWQTDLPANRFNFFWGFENIPTHFVTNNNVRMSIMANGNVGIGLGMNGTAAYLFDVNGRIRLRHNSETSGLWLNKSDNTEGTFFGQYNNDIAGIFGSGTGGSWRFGFNTTNAFMGVGVINPAEGLHIYNRSFRMDDVLSNKSIMMRPNSFTGAGEILMFEDGGDSTILIRGSDATNHGGEIVFIDPVGNTRTMELDGDYANTGRSRIIVDELQITGGADFAENFDVNPAGATLPVAGMLVCLDEANPGKLIVSNKAYDKKVAGVISGANGIKPGMMMGHRNTIANGALPVAITGRVYVMAEAIHGAIATGDLLTTSAIAGHAMKAASAKKGHGTIIGKAMTSLKAGEKGMVLLLLSIQ
ncbi:MAG: hypothetical protein V4722_25645 [Bacteroidota bacterium]